MLIPRSQVEVSRPRLGSEEGSGGDDGFSNGLLSAKLDGGDISIKRFYLFSYGCFEQSNTLSFFFFTRGVQRRWQTITSSSPNIFARCVTIRLGALMGSTQIKCPYEPIWRKMLICSAEHVAGLTHLSGGSQINGSSLFRLQAVRQEPVGFIYLLTQSKQTEAPQADSSA